MTPIIRISDSLYDRLETLAVGFDSPSNVIERLINYYENEERTSTTPMTETIMLHKQTKLSSNQNRKPRNIENEKKLKLEVGKSLNWGDFYLESQSVLRFNILDKSILCKYSSFSHYQKHWFWGVSYNMWNNWNENFYLALILENEDLISYSFILLNPKDSITLFSKCGDSGGDKKINLRYFSDGCLYLQEWKKFPILENLTNLEFK